MPPHLFAGMRVRDYESALVWYGKLLGEPAFFPHQTEAVRSVRTGPFMWWSSRPTQARASHSCSWMTSTGSLLRSLSEA